MVQKLFKDLKNLDVETCSDAELIAWTRQFIPIIIHFLYACQKLFSDDRYSDCSPCENCSKAENCKLPCEMLEKKLPGIFSGSQILNNTFGFLLEQFSNDKTANTDNHHEIPNNYNDSYLEAIDKIRSDEIFIYYKNCSNIFSKNEWRVITLRIRDGKTFKDIGQILGIGTSTASDTFQRAKRKMENHYCRKDLERYDT